MFFSLGEETVLFCKSGNIGHKELHDNASLAGKNSITSLGV
jgi:hypothetical protein